MFPEHYRFAILQLIPGQMFPVRGSPRSARVPPLNLTSPAPQCTLCPTSQGSALLQPALPAAASLRQRPNPSSCPESRLAAALRVVPCQGRNPKKFNKGKCKVLSLLAATEKWGSVKANEKRKAQMMNITYSSLCLSLPFLAGE